MCNQPQKETTLDWCPCFPNRLIGAKNVEPKEKPSYADLGIWPSIAHWRRVAKYVSPQLQDVAQNQIGGSKVVENPL
jgi:hypothetical protein